MTLEASTTPAGQAHPPSRWLLALEFRMFAELGAFAAALPLLHASVPRGDGHPVLVLPGLSVGDGATAPLRAFLRRKGYASYGWEMGRNLGPRPGIEEGLIARLKTIAAKHGRTVSLVGWSLGGLYARQLTRILPDHVRGVITLASPFNGDLRATNAWRFYERHSGRRIDEEYAGGPLHMPLHVPSTAIYSRSDGICSWRICMEREGPMAENIEVRSSHCGIRHHPATVLAIGDRLAQKEGSWQPFSRSSLRRLFFPDPQV